MKADKQIFIGILLALLLICCTTISANEVLKTETEKELMRPEEKWGIKVLGIRTTAAGYMLNFRYKILNAEKVSAFMGPRAKPYLIHQGQPV